MERCYVTPSVYTKGLIANMDETMEKKSALLVGVGGQGAADIVGAFEKMEAVRYADYLKPDGVAVINDYEIVSSTIATGAAEYPAGCLEAMQENFKCYTLNAAKIAEDLGSAKCMNIVLFGAMTAALKMDDIDWEAIIAETVPAKFKELNMNAYRAGRAAAMGE